MKDRSAYNRKWRTENAELFKQMQRDWYVRKGKAHYLKNRKKHLVANQKVYAKTVRLTRSQIMARIKSVSRVELSARKMATEIAGVSLRHQPYGLPGRPDYANKTRKVAVFIDGCFFHGCRKHYRSPKTNTVFWDSKISRNQQRRREVARELRKLGYTIITIWEHEVSKYAGRAGARSSRSSPTTRSSTSGSRRRR